MFNIWYDDQTVVMRWLRFLPKFFGMEKCHSYNSDNWNFLLCSSLQISGFLEFRTLEKNRQIVECLWHENISTIFYACNKQLFRLSRSKKLSIMNIHILNNSLHKLRFIAHTMKILSANKRHGKCKLDYR